MVFYRLLAFYQLYTAKLEGLPVASPAKCREAFAFGTRDVACRRWMVTLVRCEDPVLPLNHFALEMSFLFVFFHRIIGSIYIIKL